MRNEERSEGSVPRWQSRRGGAPGMSLLADVIVVDGDPSKDVDSAGTEPG